jgi:hypothetical protein
VARAEPRDGVILEVRPDAAALVDARATERLVALETADIDVPTPPGVTFKPPLYFRVLPLSATSLRVELWELGQSYGARSVSSAGSDTLKARRIALAAAELARQLRQRRVAELGAAQRAREAAEAPQGERTGFPIYGRFVWSASARGASVGGADAWLLGPAASTTLRFSSGQRLSLDVAWLVGAAPLLGGSGVRWLEAGLSFGQSFALGGGFAVELGLASAASAVRFDQPNGVPLDTWSARAGGFARAEQRLGRALLVSGGPDVGALLRPLTAVASDGTEHRLSGLWLGGTVTLSIDPQAP